MRSCPWEDLAWVARHARAAWWVQPPWLPTSAASGGQIFSWSRRYDGSNASLRMGEWLLELVESYQIAIFTETYSGHSDSLHWHTHTKHTLVSRYRHITQLSQARHIRPTTRTGHADYISIPADLLVFVEGHTLIWLGRERQPAIFINKETDVSRFKSKLCVDSFVMVSSWLG